LGNSPLLAGGFRRGETKKHSEAMIGTDFNGRNEINFSFLQF
jgi:hypothetical protein